MNTLALLQNISAPEILILGFVLILLFGAKRLPDLFGSLGRSIGEFKRGMHEDSPEPVSAPVAEQKGSVIETSKSA